MNNNRRSALHIEWTAERARLSRPRENSSRAGVLRER